MPTNVHMFWAYHKFLVILLEKFINITLWLFHLVFNEIPEEKARWKVNKDDACYFEQILQKQPTKQQLHSHLVCEMGSKTNKECLVRKDEFISEVLKLNSSHRCTNVIRKTKAYIHQFPANTGCCFGDLQGKQLIGTADKRKSQENLRCR